MYVDGFLLVVPKDKLAEYKKMAAMGAKIWMKHGALDYKECVGDDMDAKGMDGKPSPMNFPKAAKAKEDELVIFSYILFESKTRRNKVNKMVMADPAMSADQWEGKDMPFDMKRFSYGGFKVLVSN